MTALLRLLALALLAPADLLGRLADAFTDPTDTEPTT